MNIASLKSLALATALATGLGLQVAPAVQAAPIPIPGHTSFGAIPTATFGGTGIPNTAVAITTITDGNNTITLGMTAFQRYFNPVVTNNGNGDFYATTGVNDGLDIPPHALGATWGYGYYISIAGGGTLGGYDFSLLYDINPLSGNDESTHGTILLSSAFSTFGLSNLALFQDAQNLFSSFHTLGNAFALEPGGAFNGFAIGEYTFSLRAKDNAGNLLGESNIRVNVEAVPEPSALALIGLALLSLMGLFHMRRQAA